MPGAVFMPAGAPAAAGVARSGLAGTPPNEKSAHGKNYPQYHHVLPVHKSNITANPGGATEFSACQPVPAPLQWGMVAPFRHRHRVTYAECTVGNHIYHSRYLDLLEAARGEFLRSLGTTVLALQDAGFIFPVIEARLHYKYPARYDDLLAIDVWPTLAEGVRLNFAHRVTRQDDRLVLTAETFHACTSREEKPRRLPPELLAQIQSLIRPVEGA